MDPREIAGLVPFHQTDERVDNCGRGRESIAAGAYVNNQPQKKPAPLGNGFSPFLLHIVDLGSSNSRCLIK
ncbi:hypothetical protein HID58_002746 [Brassica napus]|uniref:Uncharacterized protein n=1 Tax=Brassica napus TaxID=3708 RepID=A0ABQ8EN50_BRANA|nr:hypothetical protein HID58_002746 [Brassica napus]